MMHHLRLIAATALMLTASGCATVDLVSRAAPIDRSIGAIETGTTPRALRDYDVVDVVVRVPGGLRVSEANSYYPNADIVWRGDPLGDRRAQVAAIVESAFTAGTAGLGGGRAVVAEVEILRFHGVTERTRYTYGGTHSIDLLLTVRDAATGAVIEGPRQVSTRLPALGGEAAIAADARGETQKVRVTTHLGMVARREFSGTL